MLWKNFTEEQSNKKIKKLVGNDLRGKKKPQWNDNFHQNVFNKLHV